MNVVSYLYNMIQKINALKDKDQCFFFKIIFWTFFSELLPAMNSCVIVKNRANRQSSFTCAIEEEGGNINDAKESL